MKEDQGKQRTDRRDCIKHGINGLSRRKEKNIMAMAEELWGAACSGDIGALKHYFESGAAANIRHQKFGREHSLVMGAFRNNQWETVDYLISIGAVVTDEEKEEIQTELTVLNTWKFCLRRNQSF